MNKKDKKRKIKLRNKRKNEILFDKSFNYR